MADEKFSWLAGVAKRLDASYADGIGVNTMLDNLPRSEEVVSLTRDLLEIIFPGFVLDDDGLDVSARLESIASRLLDQIRRAMRRDAGDRGVDGCGTRRGCTKGDGAGDCAGRCACDDSRCEKAVRALIEGLPDLREVVKKDVAAAYAGDPAAHNYDEIILSYPGLLAITVQRLAHVLYVNDVPLIPRIMTEHAHSLTGIDINPGAALGVGVFIDHGTGVVIGETAVIGDNVRIYQGVTLGAVSFPKDACGMLVKGSRRHPTIGNNVTIYSGASVLGNVTIGDNSVIGGNVWLTESLPAGTKITARTPEHRVSYRGNQGK